MPWHPIECCNIEGTLAHEFGHGYEDWITALAEGRSFVDVVPGSEQGLASKFLQEYYDTISYSARNTLSGYSSRNWSEAFAESFGIGRRRCGVRDTR